MKIHISGPDLLLPLIKIFGHSRSDSDLKGLINNFCCDIITLIKASYPYSQEQSNFNFIKFHN